jgi:hypothetical protein
MGSIEPLAQALPYRTPKGMTCAWRQCVTLFT